MFRLSKIAKLKGGLRLIWLLYLVEDRLKSEKAGSWIGVDGSYQRQGA